MEGQGYQNWGRSTYGSGGKYSRFSNEGDDSMYADSSTGFSDYDTSYNKKSRKEDKSDAYDFEISQDDDFMVESPEVQRQPVRQKSSTSTASYGSTTATGGGNDRFGGITRRSSVEDRAKEILERNRSKARESKATDDGERFTTFEQQFAEILDGIEIPKLKESQEVIPIKESVSSPKGLGSMKRPVDSPMDSVNGDSFDISATDFEVGAIAAKRIKEKAAERGRRMSFDQSAYTSQKDTSFLNAKNSASPDVKGRRSSMPEGFQMSTALSSIHKSRTSMPEFDKREANKYGSVERSDDDIYKMLNISAVNESYEKYSKLSNLDRESADVGTLRREEVDMSAMTNDSADLKMGLQSKKVYEASDADEYYDDDHFNESEGPQLRDEEQDPGSTLDRTQNTEDEYDMDDFEHDQTASRVPPPPAAEKLPVKKEVEIAKTPSSAVAASNPVDLGGLTTVEQIMQRWAYTEPTKISMEWIGTKHQSNDDDDEKLKQGILPNYMESPHAKRKEISKTESNTTTEVFAAMHEEEKAADETQEVPRNEEQDGTRYEEDFGSLSVSSTSEHAADADKRGRSKEGSKRSSPSDADRPQGVEETKVVVPISAALLSAVGNSTLVTSIPPVAPVMAAFSIPTWSVNDQPPARGTDSARGLPHDLDDDVGYAEYKRPSDDESHYSQRGREEMNADQTGDSDLLLPKPSGTGNNTGNRSRANSDIVLQGRASRADAGSRSSRYQSDSEEEDIRKLRSKSAQGRRPQSNGEPVAKSKGNYYDLLDEKEERLRTSNKQHKMAASTAAKLKQKRTQGDNTAQSQKRTIKRLSAPTRRIPEEEVVVVDQKSLEQSQKLQHLEKENIRLARKFSSLEFELRDMRVASMRRSQQGEEHSLIARKSPAMLDLKRSSFTGKSRSLLDDNYNFVETITRALEQIQQRSELLEDQRAEKELQDVVQKLLEQSNSLRDRERILVVKEKALAIRETVVGVREGTSEHNKGGDKALQELEGKWIKCEKEKVALLDEIRHVRELNVKLTSGLDSTKSELFEIKQKQESEQDINARTSMGLNPHLNMARTAKPLENLLRDLQQEKLKPYQRPSTKNKGAAKEDGSGEGKDADGVEMMSVNKKDFEDLVRDYATQERLIEGFQKENEKLSKQLKERNVEEQARRAMFFDQQEELNKELNRLRNLTNANQGGPNIVEDLILGSNQPKSAEQLRAELELDAKLRHLQEKVATLQKEGSDRERQLHNQLEKLRRENQDLQKLNKELANKSVEQLEAEVKLHQEENQRLRDKMKWFLDNQRLLEEVDQETAKQRKFINFLKEELVKKGVLPQAIKTLTEKFNRTNKDDHREPDSRQSQVLNQTADSSKSLGVKNSSHRSFADIKRIRELENTVRDLQEAIAKRYPDSVASLIHATKVTDLQQEKQCRVLESQIASLQDELSAIQAQHDKRLRSLRLEHERMKTHYETLLKETDDKLKQQSQQTQAQRARGRPSNHLDRESFDSLPKALLRISELEDEIEKLRHFYTRKIDDIQKKHDAQTRALKRGEYAEHESSPKSNQVYRQHVSLGRPSDAPPPPPPTAAPLLDRQVIDEYQKQVASITAMYSERIALLEKELMNTAEELGRVKAAVRTAPPAVPSTPVGEYFPAKPASPSTPASMSSGVSKEDVDQMIEERMKKVAADFERSRARDLQQMELDYQRKLQILESQTVSSQWLIEKEQLLREIGDEKARSSTLVQEIVFLKKSVQEDSKSPTLMQFQIMEKQLEDVEQRLGRRERELTSIIEDVKSSAKMERSRLESIHVQELREKDEQLMQFQLELEKLLLELHQWQNKRA